MGHRAYLKPNTQMDYLGFHRYYSGPKSQVQSALENIITHSGRTSCPPPLFLYGAGVEPSVMNYKPGSSTTTHIIFCTSFGTPLNPSKVVDRFKTLLKKGGLPAIRFHDLRHSAATILLSLGVHPKVVQELLGHNQISMTMDIYSHVLPSMQRYAMAKLNNEEGRNDDLSKGDDERHLG